MRKAGRREKQGDRVNEVPESVKEVYLIIGVLVV